MPELDWSEMPIHAAIKADFRTPEILIEGSLNSAKSTIGLDKEIDALMRWPGIPILLFRWNQDAVDTKMRPAFEQILSIRGISAEWDQKQRCYRLENGSLAYAFGLKAVSVIERYNKIRGLGVYRIMGDQVEEMDRGVADELRARLRPDLEASVSGRSFPFQLTFIANPSDEEFWLSKSFPTDNRIKGRKLYSLSVFDNRRLPEASLESMLRTYPPEHPKYPTMIMGQRGANIIGDPVYENTFERRAHVSDIEADPASPFLEAFEIGKKNTCWIIAQRSRYGALKLFGGVVGRGLMLDDFLGIVQTYRREWTGTIPIKTCTSPMGNIKGTNRYTLVTMLREAGYEPTWMETANAPDVQLAMVEYLSSLLRRRTITHEESLTVNADKERWLNVASDGKIAPVTFLQFAFEAGYIWDEHTVSVSNKSLRQPFDDDHYFVIMRCVENLALNFCAGQRTEDEAAAALKRARESNQASPTGVMPHAWMM